MRLRCRFRPLHDAYIKNGTIVDNDADVIFLCGDGHQVKAHKVIMASSSKFFAKVFEDQVRIYFFMQMRCNRANMEFQRRFNFSHRPTKWLSSLFLTLRLM